MALQNSLKQVIETIQDTVENNFADQIVEVFFEKFSDTKKAKDYPVMSYYIDDSGLTIGANVDTVTLRCEVMDVISGWENKNERTKEVVSTCFSISSQLVKYLQDAKDLYINDTVTVTPFDNRYKDGLGGVEFTLVISIGAICL